MKIDENTLIYDIETYTVGGKPDATKDRLRIFGCYSYKTKKIYLLTNIQEIQTIINSHKYLVGFNNEGSRQNPGYDNPILKREGIDFKYKIMIDLRTIFIQRAQQMKIKKGMLGDILMKYSLDYITKMLDLVDKNDGKKEINYDVFKKEKWTDEERREIMEYTERDIEVTKKLYEWVENYFWSFRDFINEKDVLSKVYMRAGFPMYVYKAICHQMGWPERFGQPGMYKGQGESIGGGYVAYPAGEEFKGDIYLLDFNSLYTHIMIQCNLYGRKKEGVLDDRPVWHGGGKWKVNGVYYSDKLSKVGELLRKFYYMRLFFKRKFVVVEDNSTQSMKNIKNYLGKEIYMINSENSKDLELKKVVVDENIVNEYVKLVEEGIDRREYTIKIIVNIIFGILDESFYENVYDKIAANDCTGIGRQWTLYGRKCFRDAGYVLLATDTDSWFILDHLNNKEKLMAVKDKIINDIKATLPFPARTFDAGIDDEIKYMFFFKGKNKNVKEGEVLDDDDFINKPKGLLKKNYIYVTKDNRVIIKNLGLRKKSNSPLSRKIFWDYLVLKIKEGQIKFGKTYLKQLMKDLLEKDISLAAMRKSVGNYDDYSAKHTFQAQIAQKYGAGFHFLIPNTKNIGVGKGKQFCTLEEFKEHNLTLNDIDFTNFEKELDYFTKPVVMKNIFDF